MGGSGQNSFVRDTWSRDLQKEAGHPYTRSRWYHLYLNGIYWWMCETQERAEGDYAETYFGGDELDYDVVKSFGNVADGNRESYQRLYDKMQAGFSSNAAYFNVQGKGPDGIRDPAIEKLLDLKNLIDYMIITYYTGDRDGPGSRYTNGSPNNYFGILNRVNPDGFKFFEHDSEHSLGTGDSNMVTPFTRSTGPAHFNPHTLHERLAAQNAEYRMAVSDRVAELCYNGGLMTSEVGIARVDRRVAEIEQAVFAHSARWGDANRRNHPDWQSAVQGVRDFIASRVSTLVSQLRTVGWYPDIDPPRLSQYGGYIGGDEMLTISGGPGTIYYQVNGSDPREMSGPFAPGSSTIEGSAVETRTLVNQGASWKYLDNGSNQGTAWRAPGFEDISWRSGRAELGYGDGGEQTTLGFGPNSGNKFITTYFRHTFNATNVGQFAKIQLRLRRDDGAVVYMNGQEVARSNMPGGPIGYLTAASGVSGGDDELTFHNFELSAAALVEGSNTLAVEVHQNSGGSSDISFDLSLAGSSALEANEFDLMTPGENVVHARVWNGSEWSPLTKATFLLDTDTATAQNLAITEIHYRPAVPSEAEALAGFDERSHFEYVELMNIGDRLIDLGGLAFSGGIEFAFAETMLGRTLAPGEHILLVNNLGGFEMRYGTKLPVAGEFEGNLSNGGERLLVVDANSEAMLDITFGETDPWPESVDGDGQSLVLVNPQGRPNVNDPASWRSSTGIGGTPGNSDSIIYADWKIEQGFEEDNGDPDRDGLSSLMEYAIGTDPFIPSVLAAIEPQLIESEAEGVVDDDLGLAVRRRIGADDVALSLEFSSDLGNWKANEGEFELARVLNNGDGTETITYRSVSAIEANRSRYVRAIFSLIENP